jgi:hypothetical protein
MQTLKEYAKEQLDTLYGKDPIDFVNQVKESLHNFIMDETVINPELFINKYESYLTRTYKPKKFRTKVANNHELIIKHYKDIDPLGGKLLIDIISHPFLNAICDPAFLTGIGLIRYTAHPGKESGDIDGHIKQLHMELKNNDNAIQHNASVKCNSEVPKEYEKDIIDGLSYELVAEVCRTTLTSIKILASKRDKLELQVGGQETASVLTQTILEISQLIAIKNRRGAGNFIVVSPAMGAILQTINLIISEPDNTYKNNSIFPKMGTLFNNISIYRDIFATNDYILIGYTGETKCESGVQVVLNPPTIKDNTNIDVKYNIKDDIDHPENYYEYMEFDVKGI